MMESMERVLSGYCRTTNRIPRVICEYERTEKGLTLENMDCGHAHCANTDSCELMRAARAVEAEE